MCLYGCQLWDFSSKDIELFYVAWCKCVRRVWQVPPRTHCDLLHRLSNDLPIEAQLHIRLLRFIHKVIHSTNSCTSLAGKLALSDSMSNTCNSINFLCYSYGIQKNIIQKYSLKELIYEVNYICYDKSNTQIDIHAGAIVDAIYIRDNNLNQNSELTYDEINDIISYICTN
jgi:hypothetical protein